ncbi:MAG TPA: Fe-S-binding domain-containing protein [Acidimicrobiia bacterium]|nr:Fe-S-binding domain-containing protein [Acidimicrobiia bacterium]HIL46985.1 Fe-S-binding domain-containing protein [Acidimicrobiia bacterium]
MNETPVNAPRPLVSCVIDGQEVRVPQGSTILDACTKQGIDTPTLCWAANLTPVNVCRVCVVEVEGSRTLVPSCSRPVEENMVVATDSERVRTSRRMVYELLASSVEMDRSEPEVLAWMDHYGADPDRMGPVDERATVAQPVKVEDDLYVRDYERCILCYKCVEACGDDAQHTFAIATAGRGFDAHISTEFDKSLPDSACVYCGNCIGVCPTGALVFKTEHDMRQEGTWDQAAQEVTTTVCSFCGVGCNLELHVQDDRIVKVTSPADHSVTSGHLCIKGRFGWQHAQP